VTSQPTAPVRPVAASPVTEAPPPVVLPPEPQLTPAEVQQEADKLRAALAAEVKGSTEPAAHEPDWIALAKAALAASDQPPIDRAQIIVVVDRSASVQALRLILARPGNGAWEVLGGTHVSTGQTGRFDHYVTPAGVFPHTDAILDWRAEGTFNENHIRGLGLKGMRVWDFGWQVAAKGWLDNQSGPMRLLMHATDPANLEHRIGRRASSGCVRIPRPARRPGPRLRALRPRRHPLSCAAAGGPHADAFGRHAADRSRLVGIDVDRRALTSRRIVRSD
jgi:hypothetical protein